MIEFSVSEFQFKMNHHPFYLYNDEKNENFIIKLFYPIDKEEKIMMKGLQKRLNLILEQILNVL